MAPSYAHGAGAAPLLGETIGENLDRTIARFGDREALVSVHQDVRLTYDEFGQAVDRLARALLASGIGPGDRLGIWSPNCAEWVLVQYATAKAGIVLVNINPAYRTSELAFALAQSGCRALVAARAFKSSNYAAMVDEVRARCRPSSGSSTWSRSNGGSCSTAPTPSSETGSSTSRSTSSTRAARPASPRGRPSATTTSSTTATSSVRDAVTASATGSASRSRSTTASAWSSATLPAPRTAPAW